MSAEDNDFDTVIKRLNEQFTSRLLPDGGDRSKQFLNKTASLEVFRDGQGYNSLQDLYTISKRAGLIDNILCDDPSSTSNEIRVASPTSFEVRSIKSGVTKNVEFKKESGGLARLSETLEPSQHEAEEYARTQTATSFTAASRSTDDSKAQSSVAVKDAINFSQLVVSLKNPAQRKTKILATLVLAEVTLRSKAWAVFLSRTLSRDTAFCDDDLLFETFADVDEVFVAENGSDSSFNANVLRNHFVLYPVFITKNVRIRDNHREARMPYICEQKLAESTSGDLYYVEIDPLHHDLTTNHMFRKDVRLDSLEVVIGQHLRNNGLQSSDLRAPEADITHGETVSLFIPWSQGNLEQMMINGKIFYNRCIGEKIKDFKKILGPGEALKFLHCDLRDPTTGQCKAIRHGDVTLQNILIIVDEKGKFWYKLADFGAAAIQIGKGEFICGALQGDESSCLAPECLSSICSHSESHLAAPLPGCPADVWSFGCVVLNYLVFLIKGTRAQEDFRSYRNNTPQPETGEKENERYFKIHAVQENELFMDQTDLAVELTTSRDDVRVLFKVNEEIDEFFRKLSSECKDKKETNFILNVVDAVKSIALVPNPEQRGTITELLKSLNHAASPNRRQLPLSKPTSLIPIDGSLAQHNQENLFWQLICKIFGWIVQLLFLPRNLQPGRRP